MGGIGGVRRQSNRNKRFYEIVFMDEEKERQKEIREKLESEGLDPEEFDEDEREELADLL